MESDRSRRLAKPGRGSARRRGVGCRWELLGRPRPGLAERRHTCLARLQPPTGDVANHDPNGSPHHHQGATLVGKPGRPGRSVLAPIHHLVGADYLPKESAPIHGTAGRTRDCSPELGASSISTRDHRLDGPTRPVTHPPGFSAQYNHLPRAIASRRKSDPISAQYNSSRRVIALRRKSDPVSAQCNSSWRAVVLRRNQHNLGIPHWVWYYCCGVREILAGFSPKSGSPKSPDFPPLRIGWHLEHRFSRSAAPPSRGGRFSHNDNEVKQ